MPVSLKAGTVALSRRNRREDLVDLGSQGCEAGSIQHSSRRIANFLHGEMDPADRLVAAIGTALVGRLTGTRDRREGPVEHPNHLAQIDVRWIPGKQISTPLPFSASQQPLVLETEENELEKFRGDLFGLGEIGDAHRLLAIPIGECEEGFDGVLGLL
jgi:hypothetical protein